MAAISQLSTVRLEWAIPLLAQLDIPAIYSFLEEMQAKPAGYQPTAEDIQRIVSMASKIGESRILRQLIMVLQASDEELFLAETNLTLKSDLLKKASAIPIGDGFKAITAFMKESGLFKPPTLDSSKATMES